MYDVFWGGGGGVQNTNKEKVCTSKRGCDCTHHTPLEWGLIILSTSHPHNTFMLSFRTTPTLPHIPAVCLFYYNISSERKQRLYLWTGYDIMIVKWAMRKSINQSVNQSLVESIAMQFIALRYPDKSYVHVTVLTWSISKCLFRNTNVNHARLLLHRGEWTYHQLRVRRVLMLFNDVPLRTRWVILLFCTYCICQYFRVHIFSRFLD